MLWCKKIMDEITNLLSNSVPYCIGGGGEVNKPDHV